MSARAMRWAESILSNAKLPPAEAAVLTWLCWKHNDSTNECFPSVETLGALSGYRRRRVFDELANLEARGLIKRHKRREGRSQASNGYQLFGRLKLDAKLRPKGGGKGFQGADGGTLSEGHICAPSQGADGGTLSGCPPVTHDRGERQDSGQEVRPGGLTREFRLLAGGRSHA